MCQQQTLWINKHEKAGKNNQRTKCGSRVRTVNYPQACSLTSEFNITTTHKNEIEICKIFERVKNTMGQVHQTNKGKGLDA